MSQELGRIERPSAERFRGKRILLLAPLVYGPGGEEPEAVQVLTQYWEQVQMQVASLERSLGQLRHIYHESLTEGGEAGLKQLEAVDQRSYSLIQSRCQSGATLEATEDEETLVETLDLQRCLMLPFASERVMLRLQEWHTASNRQRYEHISRTIDTTLKQDELGLLLISERHQAQFPADVEVFYISPPALDEYHRWLQSWLMRQQQQAAKAEQSES